MLVRAASEGSYLVTIEWKGLKDNSKPLAFVGKGVCFDTGGISLKPAKFMEDMTYDMAGSAVDVGLMKSLHWKSKSKCSRCCRTCREYAGWKRSKTRDIKIL